MKIVLLSGGVGGARMARGLAALPEVATTVVVNIADDAVIYGLHISPDLDTVVYTLAGIEGEQGWGRWEETWTAMEELDRFPIDSSFRLGDRDLATHLFRTDRLAAGWPLSHITRIICERFGVGVEVLPASDDEVRTFLLPEAEETWIDFQTYFVRRRHADTIRAVRFDGATTARAAPGVLEAIGAADAVVIGPSNPVVSISPILAIEEIASALKAVPRVMAVSPLIGGRALKGPAAQLLSSLGYPPANAGVLASYGGIVTDLVVDTSDGGDLAGLEVDRSWVTDIRIPDRERAVRLAREVVSWLS